ncbi:MAG TPA: cytochrome b/b6 domain-containing protein [Devosia sp.]
MTNKSRGYSPLQVVLHWTIAALVIFQLLVNGGMQDAFDDLLNGDPIEEMNWALLHIGVGVTVLLLAIVRVLARWRLGAPPHEGTSQLVRWISWLTHLLLYGFIFFMPSTGALAWFFGIEFSAELHELGRLILIPLIGLHVIGGLVEHFVFQNDTLMRMLRLEQE